MLLDLALEKAIQTFLSSSLIDFLPDVILIILKLFAHIMNNSLFLLIDFFLTFIDYFRSAYVLKVEVFSRKNRFMALLTNFVVDDCFGDVWLYRIAILTLS